MHAASLGGSVSRTVSSANLFEGKKIIASQALRSSQKNGLYAQALAQVKSIRMKNNIKVKLKQNSHSRSGSKKSKSKVKENQKKKHKVKGKDVEPAKVSKTKSLTKLLWQNTDRVRKSISPSRHHKSIFSAKDTFREYLSAKNPYQNNPIFKENIPKAFQNKFISSKSKATHFQASQNKSKSYLKAKKKIPLKGKQNKQTKKAKPNKSKNNNKSHTFERKNKPKKDVSSSNSARQNELSRKKINQKQRQSLNQPRPKNVFQRTILTEGETRQKSRRKHTPKRSSAQKANESATKIQKCFRGYITRKYLKQCLQHYAATKIQCFWRKYRQRIVSNNPNKPLKISPSYFCSPSLQSPQRKQLILDEHKQCISDKKRDQQDDYIELRNTNRESQVPLKMVKEQYLLQSPGGDKWREMFEQILREPQLNPVLRQKIQVYLLQGTSRSRVQRQISSQRKFIEDTKRSQSSSPQLVIDHLMVVRQFHRKKVLDQSKEQQALLQGLFLQKVYSPKTFQSKMTEIQTCVQRQIKHFQDSLTEVVDSCKQYEEEAKAPFNQNKEEQSVEMVNYKEKTWQAFDASYSFIQEYLLSWIDFVRTARDGVYLREAMRLLAQPRSLSIGEIAQNLDVVTESAENAIAEIPLFRLPMYNIQFGSSGRIQCRILRIIQVIQKLHRNIFITANPLQQYFVQMVMDSFNLALNQLRPTQSLFTDRSLLQANYSKQLRKKCLSIANEECSEFQVQCACAMECIFVWNQTQCGKLHDIKSIGEEDAVREARVLAQDHIDQEMVEIWNVQSKDLSQQLLQIIAMLSNVLLVELLEEECELIEQMRGN